MQNIQLKSRITLVSFWALWQIPFPILLASIFHAGGLMQAAANVNPEVFAKLKERSIQLSQLWNDLLSASHNIVFWTVILLVLLLFYHCWGVKWSLITCAIAAVTSTVLTFTLSFILSKTLSVFSFGDIIRFLRNVNIGSAIAISLSLVIHCASKAFRRHRAKQ